MIKRITTNPYLVFIVLIHDLYNIIQSYIKGINMEALQIDWVAIFIKVLMCTVIFLLIKYVNELKEMITVHKAISLYRTREQYLQNIDASKEEQKAIFSGFLQHEKNEVIKYLCTKYPEKSRLEIDKIISKYYTI